MTEAWKVFFEFPKQPNSQGGVLGCDLGYEEKL